ncbi:hypothetical protein [Wohlfahrtiimonas larvae]|nr:hypothetical protein [Wohlfahrtiimonas larvae]
MKLLKKFEDGFILFITLMMLIVFAILGIGLYQQTASSTVSVQYVTFKQEAEDLAMLALNKLEANLNNPAQYKQRSVCTSVLNDQGESVLVNKEDLCDPISDKTINDALTELRETGGLRGGTENKPGWENLIDDDFKGAFSGDGNVFFITQQLGQDKECKSRNCYLLYRITIIAQVLDAYSVISAISAVPANGQGPNPPEVTTLPPTTPAIWPIPTITDF